MNGTSCCAGCAHSRMTCSREPDGSWSHCAGNATQRLNVPARGPNGLTSRRQPTTLRCRNAYWAKGPAITEGSPVKCPENPPDVGVLSSERCEASVRCAGRWQIQTILAPSPAAAVSCVPWPGLSCWLSAGVEWAHLGARAPRWSSGIRAFWGRSTDAYSVDRAPRGGAGGGRVRSGWRVACPAGDPGLQSFRAFLDGTAHHALLGLRPDRVRLSPSGRCGREHLGAHPAQIPGIHPFRG